MTGSPVTGQADRTGTTDSTDSKVEGSTAPGFEPVAAEFGRLLARERDARGQ